MLFGMDVFNGIFPTVLSVLMTCLVAFLVTGVTWLAHRLLKKLDIQGDKIDTQTETLTKVEVLVNSNMHEAQEKIGKLEEDLKVLRDTEIAALKSEISTIKDLQVATEATAMRAAKETELSDIRAEISRLALIISAMNPQSVPPLPTSN